ncbi:methyltransferase domain-containing protein [Nocardia otitidiscaviarum]|uniref:methyltransferase domain-containing protein n=1 Tax=Nocardia otitidiscaviarum TaxID=1823 RepID=UPI001C8F21D8|nr:methyltransferase domain-containing protein [Nocardia otitidiscaviarum]
MLVTSRSAAEYRAMFDLSDADLNGWVLDCCAGGASFAAETGQRVVAADPVYAVGVDEVEARVSAGLREGDDMIDAHAECFEWGWYGDIESRRSMRHVAGARFLADLRARPGRYVAAALPQLPFATAAFDLVLCSHLLFTWADRLGEDWHRRALHELLRVSRGEVRVYPLVVQATGEPVVFLDRLRAELHSRGHRTELREVTYRFQRGAHHMLRIQMAHRPIRARRR